MRHSSVNRSFDLDTIYQETKDVKFLSAAFYRASRGGMSIEFITSLRDATSGETVGKRTCFFDKDVSGVMFLLDKSTDGTHKVSHIKVDTPEGCKKAVESLFRPVVESPVTEAVPVKKPRGFNL